MMNYPKSPRPRIKRCKSESNVRGLTIGNIHALQNVSKGPSLPILCQVGYLRRLVKNSRNLSSIAITLDNWNGIWLTHFLWVKKKKENCVFHLVSWISWKMYQVFHVENFLVSYLFSFLWMLFSLRNNRLIFLISSWPDRGTSKHSMWYTMCCNPYHPLR